MITGDKIQAVRLLEENAVESTAYIFVNTYSNARDKFSPAAKKDYGFIQLGAATQNLLQDKLRILDTRLFTNLPK